MAVVAVSLAAALAAAGPAQAQRRAAPSPASRTPERVDEPVYRWTDDQGQLHMTQGLGSVPEQYRQRATSLGVISSPPPAPRPAGPDPRERLPLDDALRRARTTFDYLILARRYRSHGFAEEARAAVRLGAAVAATSDEWHAVAASYDTLGMAQAADAARRRAGATAIR